MPDPNENEKDAFIKWLVRTYGKDEWHWRYNIMAHNARFEPGNEYYEHWKSLGTIAEGGLPDLTPEEYWNGLRNFLQYQVNMGTMNEARAVNLLNDATIQVQKEGVTTNLPYYAGAEKIIHPEKYRAKEWTPEEAYYAVPGGARPKITPEEIYEQDKTEAVKQAQAVATKRREMEARQLQEHMAGIPATGDVYYPFLEQAGMSPNMLRNYQANLPWLLAEFEREYPGEREKWWRRGFEPTTQKTPTGDRIRLLEEAMERKKEQIRHWQDVGYTTITGEEGKYPIPGTAGKREAFIEARQQQLKDIEKRLEKEKLKKGGYVLRGVKDPVTGEVTFERAGKKRKKKKVETPDPFAKYLAEYPFMAKWYEKPPAQRGYQPSRYAPTTRWLTY